MPGCDNLPQTWSRSDIEEIASDAASDASAQALVDSSDVADHLDRIETLESDRDDLQRKTELLTELVENQQSQIDLLNSSISDLENRPY